ncbi:hypothetical protein, partial [Klebsiella aerogenes]|uniref:hypothetical protein n=1 Tax=Klebsiella aerogenes TaxID=548 RepID=UPI00195399DD
TRSGLAEGRSARAIFTQEQQSIAMIQRTVTRAMANRGGASSEAPSWGFQTGRSACKSRRFRNPHHELEKEWSAVSELQQTDT